MVNRKVMITEDEAERFAEATVSISAAFGSQVTYSQITRVLWALACGGQDAIRARTRRIPEHSRPIKGGSRRDGGVRAGAGGLSKGSD